MAEQVFVSLSPQDGVPRSFIAAVRTPQSHPVRLVTNDRSNRLWLRVMVSLLVVTSVPADSAIASNGYTFQLYRGDGRTRFDEIVAYHWTPNDPTAKRTWPHLHIGSAFIDPAARREPLALHKTHFLTGSITAPGFVRMAIEEFGAQPVVADWQEQLVEDGVLS
ncbi:MAG: hypothetical protein QM589_01110 [Thermomicrobiales bacterium]